MNAPRLVVTNRGVQLKHQPIPNMNIMIGISVDLVNQVRVNLSSKKPTIRIMYLGAGAVAPRRLFVF